MVGWPCWNHGKARVIWWDGQGATWHVQGLMWTWSGCNMGWPGLRTMHYIEPDPGGPLWLSIHVKQWLLVCFAYSYDVTYQVSPEYHFELLHKSVSYMSQLIQFFLVTMQYLLVPGSLLNFQWWHFFARPLHHHPSIFLNWLPSLIHIDRGNYRVFSLFLRRWMASCARHCWRVLHVMCWFVLVYILCSKSGVFSRAVLTYVCIEARVAFATGAFVVKCEAVFFLRRCCTKGLFF